MTVQDRIRKCKILMLMNKYPVIANEIGLLNASYFCNIRFNNAPVVKEPDKE